MTDDNGGTGGAKAPGLSKRRERGRPPEALAHSGLADHLRRSQHTIRSKDCASGRRAENNLVVDRCAGVDDQRVPVGGRQRGAVGEAPETLTAGADRPGDPTRIPSRQRAAGGYPSRRAAVEKTYTPETSVEQGPARKRRRRGTAFRIGDDDRFRRAHPMRGERCPQRRGRRGRNERAIGGSRAWRSERSEIKEGRAGNVGFAIAPPDIDPGVIERREDPGGVEDRPAVRAGTKALDVKKNGRTRHGRPVRRPAAVVNRDPPLFAVGEKL